MFPSTFSTIKMACKIITYSVSHEIIIFVQMGSYILNINKNNQTAGIIDS